MKQIYLSFVLLFFSCFLFGQGATITGTIYDSSDAPLPGVTVRLEGTNLGAASDEEGRYMIKTMKPGEFTLVYSFIGFKTIKETIVAEEDQLMVIDKVMYDDTEFLDEVVVVGYGVQRKRASVGSISTIESKEVNDVIGGSFDNSLQGKAPGLQITQSSGVAGAGSVIRVRGSGSITAGGDPLVVVDGIPIITDNFIAGDRNAQNNNPLAAINPNDIESVEILKDASATAIYGSRGANGVIIITTKRGLTKDKSKPQYSFSARWGLSTPSVLPEMLTAQEWIQIQQEAWENDGNVGRAPLPNNLSYDDIEGVNTNWIDEVIEPGFKQDYNFSVRTGGSKIRTYSGVSYTNSGSFLKDNKLKRYSGRFNVDILPIKWLQLSLSTGVSRTENEKVRQAWAGGLGYALSTALPIFPIHNEAGDYYSIYTNPVAQAELTDDVSHEWRSFNSFNVIVKPIKGLEWITSGNYEFMRLNDYTFEDLGWTNTFNVSKRWRYTLKNRSIYSTVAYQVPIKNKKHQLKAMAGTEYSQYDKFERYTELENIDGHIFGGFDLADNIDPEIGNPNHFGSKNEDKGGIDQWKFHSYFTRWNYSFKDRYLLQLVYRYDGSSKFGSQKRFGSFPSIGVGWIVSDEGFMENQDVINFLKLKASWGYSGNSDIDWDEQYVRFETNSTATYNGQPIIFQKKFANRAIQWESSQTYDAGLELGLWKDRVSLEFSYYYRLVREGFLGVKLPASTGIDEDGSTYFTNVARVKNHGIDWMLTATILDKPMRWKTTFTFSRNKNEVLDVGTATPDALDGGFGDTRAILGASSAENFIVPFSHIDPESGAPVYLDAEGNETFVYDPVLNRQALGTAFPDFYGAIRNTFTYKRFSLDILCNYRKGGTVYDDAAKRQLGVITPDWNYRTEIYDHWDGLGDVATYPQLTTSMLNWGGNANAWQNNHSLWLHDASYFRIKNITASYELPTKKKFLKQANVFVSATNVFLLAAYYGDPEVARERPDAQQRNVGGIGVTYLTSPQEKTYNLGVNVQF